MPAEAGVTATAATGTVVTAIAAVPLCPSLVAERVAEPGAMPVTSPLPLTVATDGFELDQLTARPESVLPLASLSVAASCCVWQIGRASCRERVEVPAEAWVVTDT